MLTDDQTAYLRSELGPDLDLVDLETRFDRLGNVRDVVMEITREQMNALIAAPAQYALAGTYSQSSAENIKALERKLQRLHDDLPSGVEAGSTLVVAKVKPRSRRS